MRRHLAACIALLILLATVTPVGAAPSAIPSATGAADPDYDDCPLVVWVDPRRARYFLGATCIHFIYGVTEETYPAELARFGGPNPGPYILVDTGEALTFGEVAPLLRMASVFPKVGLTQFGDEAYRPDRSLWLTPAPADCKPAVALVSIEGQTDVRSLKPGCGVRVEADPKTPWPKVELAYRALADAGHAVDLRNAGR